MDLPLGPPVAHGGLADGGAAVLEKEASFFIPEDGDGCLGDDDDAIPDDHEDGPGSECRRASPMLLGASLDPAYAMRESSEAEPSGATGSPCTHASAITLFGNQEQGRPSFSRSSTQDSATLPADAQYRARGPQSPAGLASPTRGSTSSRLWPDSPHSGQPVSVYALPATVKHGESLLTKKGFTGEGPFWTAGIGLQSRELSRLSDAAAADGACTSGVPPANGCAGCADISDLTSGDLSSRFGALASRCVAQLAGIIDVPLQDEPPPESELTTVLLETKEQRLQWRDFLSEAVSKSRANALYVSSDVDPLPLPYAKPPASSAHLVRLACRSPLRVIAPHGAGWTAARDAPSSAPSAPEGRGESWFGDKGPRQPDVLAEEEPGCEDGATPADASGSSYASAARPPAEKDGATPAYASGSAPASAARLPAEKARSDGRTAEALAHSLSSSSSGDQPARAG